MGVGNAPARISACGGRRFGHSVPAAELRFIRDYQRRLGQGSIDSRTGRDDLRYCRIQRGDQMGSNQTRRDSEEAAGCGKAESSWLASHDPAKGGDYADVSVVFG